MCGGEYVSFNSSQLATKNLTRVWSALRSSCSQSLFAFVVIDQGLSGRASFNASSGGLLGVGAFESLQSFILSNGIDDDCDGGIFDDNDYSCHFFFVYNDHSCVELETFMDIPVTSCSICDDDHHLMLELGDRRFNERSVDVDPRNYTHLIQHFVLAGYALTVELHESFAADCDHLSMFALVDAVSLQGVIPNQLWLNAPALTAVHVDGVTEVTSVSRSLGSLQQLRSLVLTGVYGLQSLPATIGSLSSLTTLTAAVSAVTVIPSSIASLTALQRLSVNENADLSSLPSGIGSLVSLETIHFFSCSLTSVPRSLGSLRDSLATTWMYNTEATGTSGNALSSLPLSMGSLSNLLDLNAGDSSLMQVPSSIGSLGGLLWLRLDNSMLTQLPRSFELLSNVEKLVVSYSELLSLPPGLSSIVKCMHLYVNRNSLTSLPMSLGSLESLSQVLVTFNDVTILPREWCTRVESGDLQLDVDVETIHSNSTCAVAACSHRSTTGFNCDDVLRLYSGVTCLSLESVYGWNCFGCRCSWLW